MMEEEDLIFKGKVEDEANIDFKRFCHLILATEMTVLDENEVHAAIRTANKETAPIRPHWFA